MAAPASIHTEASSSLMDPGVWRNRASASGFHPQMGGCGRGNHA